MLIIAPHPDDETIGCGGTVVLSALKPLRLDIVFLTDGSASHPKHPIVSPSNMAKRRRDEALAAANVLGVKSDRMVFLNVRDGSLSHLDPDQAEKLEATTTEVLTRLSPEAILLPCRSDGSSEHEAAFAFVDMALKKSGIKTRVIEFPVWSWWNPLLMLPFIFSHRAIWRVDIRSTRHLKARAIATYASQTQPIPPDTKPALPQGFAEMFLGGSEYFFEC